MAVFVAALVPQLFACLLECEQTTVKQPKNKKMSSDKEEAKLNHYSYILLSF